MGSFKILILFFLIGIIFTFFLVYYEGMNAQSYTQKKLENFAKCLAKKGVELYGTYWCPVCKKQKEIFGKGFKYIKYVECSKEIQKCIDKNIKNVPTWIFPGNEKIEGFLPLEILSKKTGCSL